MADELANFFDLARSDLEEAVQRIGQARYRADQVWNWVYRQRVDSFQAMTNLPATLRRQLASQFSLNPATVIASQSDDESGTHKHVLRLGDGETIETVLMKEPYGYTVCLSTQVGCPLACTICATGQAGFHRNLTVGEIVFQLLHFDRLLTQQLPPSQVTNIVFMGMGEPLLNYEATVGAIARFCDPYGLALSAHGITVSTVGLPQRILDLAAEPYPVRLAISLHSAEEAVRARLLPIAGRISLEELIAACREYARVRQQRITFEYVLVKGVNDRKRDARQLVALIGALPAHVNLIPLNPIENCDLQPAAPEAIEYFRSELRRSRIACTVRYSRGVRIRAGCGQLRGQAE
ncbi:MAG: 23S rRNA (adenine(2503)-C(2))-methyltransferase RlmN [Anaerolineae bacterium]